MIGHPGTKPGSLADYLELMSKVIMSAGMNWHVVEAKEDGLRKAFKGFDPKKVAVMTQDDIDRLMHDPGVIRNRRKLDAIVENAKTMLELDREYGGFEKYLRSRGGYAAAVADLKRNFAFVGDSSAYLFLWAAGEQVPSHKDWEGAHRRKAVA
jgi:DNA-3-methyladenine glycosylase I